MSESVPRVVKKDSSRFPRKRPQYSTALLKPEPEALGRAQANAHIDRREVEALGDEVATDKYLEPSGAKIGDRQGTNFARGFAIDALGGISCAPECNGPSPSGINGDIEDDGAGAGGDASVVLDAIAGNAGAVDEVDD